MPVSFVCPRLVERIGLRATITLAISLAFAGSLLRCITTKAPYALVLAHLGQILNAAAGPLGTFVETCYQSSPPLLSPFPPSCTP